MSKGVLSVAVVALAVVPQQWARVLSDVVMVVAFFSTYVLPGMSIFPNLCTSYLLSASRILTISPVSFAC